MAGRFVDLTNMPLVKNYTPSTLDSSKFNGRMYTVPTGLSYYTGAYYNKAIFAEYGLSIPATWTQSLQLCQTLKASGVMPLGIGDKDSWPAGLNMLAAPPGASIRRRKTRTRLAQGLWQSLSLTDPTPEQVLKRTGTMFELA